jgi:hypothetical protein
MRPPKREQLQQDRAPLNVEAFDSADEYLEARELRRTGGRRILYPTAIE